MPSPPQNDLSRRHGIKIIYCWFEALMIRFIIVLKHVIKERYKCYNIWCV